MKITLLAISLLLCSCDWLSSSQRSQVRLQNDDVSAARQGFEDGLLRKIHAAGGEPNQVEIEEAALNPSADDQVLITYKIVYTLPPSQRQTPMVVTYKGKSTLQASPGEQDHKTYVWHVLNTAQIDYSVEYLKTSSGA